MLDSTRRARHIDGSGRSVSSERAQNAGFEFELGGAEYRARAVPQEPLAELPDEVTLSRDEAAVILFGLDVVEQAMSTRKRGRG